MRKVFVCVCVYLIVVAGSYKSVSADEGTTLCNEEIIESHISGIYKQIDFSNCDKLAYDVFDKAYRGYLNLCNAGKLNTGKEVISVCDFSLPSTQNRLWIIDLDKKKVLFNTYVAHGQGSGEEYAESFSNNFNSHQSSLGFYVTGDTYDGEHGTSLHLNGMDEGFNDAAFDRGIVVHGADYVCRKFVNENQKLGRSWGCPAVPARLSLPIINTIKDSTCLFIYYPDSRYLGTSYWLNRKVTNLPQPDMYADMTPPVIAKPKVRIIQYVTNGRVDSVRTVPVGE